MVLLGSSSLTNCSADREVGHAGNDDVQIPVGAASNAESHAEFSGGVMLGACAGTEGQEAAHLEDSGVSKTTQSKRVRWSSEGWRGGGRH